MATYLILRKTGPDSYDVVNVVMGRPDDGAERAIQESVSKEGEYISVPFDEDIILRKQAQHEITLTDPPEPTDKALPESESEPTPESSPAPEV